jgi:hypothetical protein
MTQEDDRFGPRRFDALVGFLSGAGNWRGVLRRIAAVPIAGSLLVLLGRTDVTGAGATPGIGTTPALARAFTRASASASAAAAIAPKPLAMLAGS